MALSAVFLVGLFVIRCSDVDPAARQAGPFPAAVGAGARPLPEGPVFVDVTDAAGIDHTHHKPELDPRLGNIMPWMASVGAAVAAADYDGDGDIDLYATDSRTGYPNYLYRNDGGFRFTEVAGEAGVARVNDDRGTSMDAVFGDVDNDGDLDLYVVKWGCNVLFRNDGDGSFTDVTERAGVGDCGNGNAALFIDHDLDGDLDLMVGNYFQNVDLWNLSTTRIMHDSFETARNAGPNLFYRNNGDGSFTEIAEILGLNDTGWTLDIGCGDIDNDGDQDCYIANDFGGDSLFRNEGDGTFLNITAQAIGVDTKKGMNVDFGDYNNDGFLDIYVTNITTLEYLREGNMLWHNMRDGTFVDVGYPTESDDGGWGWAGKFLDYDNDGRLDIFTVNGFVSAGEETYWFDLATMATTPDLDTSDSRNWPTMGDRSFSGYEPFRLFRNEDFIFVERAAEAGVADTRDGRGIAVADFDEDGWLDLFVATQGDRPVLYRNQGRRGHHWIAFDLRQTGRNTRAIGARVTVRAGELTQIREIDGGNGYASQSSTRLHFGLGPRQRIDEVIVRWPDGVIERLDNPRVDQLVRRWHPREGK